MATRLAVKAETARVLPYILMYKATITAHQLCQNALPVSISFCMQRMLPCALGQYR